MERRRGKRVALTAAAAAAVTVVAAVIVLKDRLLEEWYLHRLGSGDKTAEAWLGEHGGERTIVALCEIMLSCFPESILVVELSEMKNFQENMQPAAFRRFDRRVRSTEFASIPQTEAIDKIYRRMGDGQVEKLVRKELARDSGSSRLRVCYARGVVAKPSDFSRHPGTVALALDRLRESLADPDPIVRAGAMYGLAQGGERRPETLERIAALKSDPDEVVREAAAYAHDRLTSLREGLGEKP